MLSAARRPLGPTDPLPFPRNLAALVHDRISALPSDSRAALEIVALSSPATVELLARATDSDALMLLEPAIEIGVVELVGERIVFTHPLLASAVSSSVSAAHRRELHRLLAEAVEEPERHGRHLALAADGPSPAIANALDKAAAAAVARGAIAAAAELGEHARRLTPSDDDDGALRRALVAAAFHFEAGDAVRARALLEDALASAPPGERRAEALVGLARTHGYAADIRVAVRLFRRAIGEAGEESRVRAEAEHGLAAALMRMLDDLPTAAHHARTAAELAERLDDQAALADYLATLALIEGLQGKPHAVDAMERAVIVEGTFTRGADHRPGQFLRVLRGAGFMLGVLRGFTDDLDGARTQLEAARIEGLELGDESSLPLILRYLSTVELSAGNWSAAGHWAADGYEVALQMGQPAAAVGARG